MSSDVDETQTNTTTDTPNNDYIDIDEFLEHVFPYDTPYDDQETAIRNTITTFRNNGVNVVEGPCGTGKTLISLMAALAVIRDPTTDFEQALCITSVKQQQSAFEDDIKTINENIIEQYEFARDAPPRYQPVTGLTLVGKADLCPYVDSDSITRDNISPRCSTLMTDTNRAAAGESIGSDGQARGAREILETTATHTPGTDNEYTALENAEHPTDPVPFNGTPVCPYYAQHLLNDEEGNNGVKYEWSMLDAETLRAKAAALGTCPYTAMQDGLENAEIIIGNYAHVFHDTTAEVVTQPVLNSKTLLIVDEAHMLPEKVRDYESISQTHTDIATTIDDIDHVLSELPGLSESATDKVKQEFQRYNTSKSELQEFKALTSELHNMIERVVQSSVSETNAEYEDAIPFRDPEELEDDRFDKWLEYIDVSDEVIENAKYIGKAVGGALRVIADVNNNDGENEYPVEVTGDLITKKHYAGNAEYFSEIKLHGNEPYSTWEYNGDDPPRSNYHITVHVHNCNPANRIRRELETFGGSMLMSATLSPLEVYTEITGVEELPRSVQTNEYELRFPESKRGSFIVPLQKFTRGNRGSTTASNETRAAYIEAIRDVITNADGNTLICMPSYAEAEWVHDELNNVLPNPMYLDESSSNEETMALKRAFEQQSDGVLLTSLRGTLTEGVDYAGDKLSNVIICGVPLTYPYSNEATARRTAYAVAFGRAHAFDYAHTVPAMYKTRQAIGRVIRSTEDVGTRVLIDERYSASGQSVNEFLSVQEQDEFEVITKKDIGQAVQSFWGAQ